MGSMRLLRRQSPQQKNQSLVCLILSFLENPILTSLQKQISLNLPSTSLYVILSIYLIIEFIGYPSRLRSETSN